MNFLSFFKPLGRWLIKHSPELLIGTGIAGMVAGTILAVKAKPKADAAINALNDNVQEEFDNEQRDDNVPTLQEKIKCLGPIYLPAIGMSVLGAGLIIGSAVIKNKRYSALATAYSFGAEAIKEYQTKLEELHGKEKANAISKEINEKINTKNEVIKRIDATHRYSTQDIINCIPGNGPDLIYDHFGGRFFWGSKDEVERAFTNVIAKTVRDIGGTYTVNDLYSELLLTETEAGYLGFDSERGRMNRLVWEPYTPDDKIIAWSFSFAYEPTEYGY